MKQMEENKSSKEIDAQVLRGSPFSFFFPVPPFSCSVFICSEETQEMEARYRKSKEEKKIERKWNNNKKIEREKE